MEPGSLTMLKKDGIPALTESIQDLILSHFAKYPDMQIEDVFKLLYQNEFGCGHMVETEQSSLEMILAEASALSPEARRHGTMEPIGNGLCRIYLSALKQSLQPEALNRIFVMTANRARGSAEGFEEKALAFRQLCEAGHLPYDPEEVSRLLEGYRAAGYPPMRHSERYRQAYAPAYRVVDESCCSSLSHLRKQEAI